MAEGGGDLKKITNDLEKEVTCGICQELFKEPKLLPCSHYFCKQCIVKLCLRKPAGNSISCPECRTEFAISRDAIDDLKTAFNINRLMDIYKSQLQCYEAEKPKKTPITTSKLKGAKCKKHDDFMLLYCYSCGCFICRDCAITKHKQHEYEYNTTAVPKRRKELLQSKDWFSDREKEYEGALIKMRERVADIDTSGNQVADFMSSYFKQLHDILDQKEALMRKEHNEVISTKITKLKEQETNLTQACNDLSTVQDKIDSHFSSCLGDDILGMSKELMKLIETKKKQLPKIRGNFWFENWSRLFRSISSESPNFEVTPTVSEHRDVVFKTSPADFSDKFENFVSISYPHISCDDEFSIEEHRTVIRTKQHNYFHIYSSKKSNFTAKISSSGTVESECQVSRIGCYTYLVQYTSPWKPGKYDADIFDDGKKIRTLSFRVN